MPRTQVFAHDLPQIAIAGMPGTAGGGLRPGCPRSTFGGCRSIRQCARPTAPRLGTSRLDNDKELHFNKTVFI
jgi:hypothetical protein